MVPKPKPANFAPGNDAGSTREDNSPVQIEKPVKKGMMPQKTVRMKENLFKAIGVVAKDLDISEQDYLHQIIEKDVATRLREAQQRAISEVQNIRLD